MDQKLQSIRIPDCPPLSPYESLRKTGYYELVDQLLLPHVVEWRHIHNSKDAFGAIKSMQIRGAPAIGSAAALSVALEIFELIADKLLDTEKLLQKTKTTLDYLVSARPTAVNLSEAMKRIWSRGQEAIKDNLSTLDIAEAMIECAILVWTEDLERNKRMGLLGCEWISSQISQSNVDTKVNVVTVCNTGSLATSGYGTAFGLITALHEMGKLGKVFFAQTAPYNQGARLTALEFKYLGIDAVMVPDTAMASLLQRERIDAFIAGADRIALNGDTANKVSTYQIALLCHHVPMVGKSRPRVIISAPWTTVDTQMENGSTIVIEQRPEIEACTVKGLLLDDTLEPAGEVVRQGTILFTPKDTRAYNPAFDVTPGTLIDAIVTDRGVFEADEGQSFVLR